MFLEFSHSVYAYGVVHMRHEFAEHDVASIRFSSQIAHYAGLCRGKDRVYSHRVFLTKTPAPTDGLVILFERMRGEISHPVAVLPIHSERGNLRLRDKYTDLSVAKRPENLVLAFIAARSVHRFAFVAACLMPISVNAARAASGLDAAAFGRDEAYIGVLIDDLVTRGVTEPYRMFTSRAEYRLKLRADNADQRLTPLGVSLGCVRGPRKAAFDQKASALSEAAALLDNLSLTPSEAGRHGLEINRDGRRRSAFELLAFPGVSIGRLSAIWPELQGLDPGIAAQLETDGRYAEYVRRQDADVEALRRDEAVRLPADLDYGSISGLSAELRQKLGRHRPSTIAQAARIEGMTPSALLLLVATAKAGERRQPRPRAIGDDGEREREPAR
mgnify:CR=1 FL=1